MKLASRDLQQLVERTLGHYDQGAEDFWEGTRDHKVGQTSPRYWLLAITALSNHAASPPVIELRRQRQYAMDHSCRSSAT